jgi:bisphosphoglycerate-dependent phosphoglycerate mutase
MHLPWLARIRILTMTKLVLLRHGQSAWNEENRFTGWTDVDLSRRGREEALEAGKFLKSQGYSFDWAYTSLAGRSPIVAAHGNTLRALVKYLDGISDAAIPELEIPTGVLLVYELDDNLHPLARYYLGNSPSAEEGQKHLDHVVSTAGQVA